MATREPLDGRRTRTLPRIVPLLVVGFVLLGFVAVFLAVKGLGGGSVAHTICPPVPTPTRNVYASTPRLGPPPNEPNYLSSPPGIPSIEPTNTAANQQACDAPVEVYLHPGTPSFTAAAAATFAAKRPNGFFRMVPGSAFKVVRATFESMAQANTLFHIISGQLPVNNVACVVLVGGQFYSGRLGPGGKQIIMDGVYEVYDGHTGNLLMIGSAILRNGIWSH